MYTVDRNIRRNTDFTAVMIHMSEHTQPVNGRDINKGAVEQGAFGIPQDIVINMNGKYDLTPRWLRAANPLQYEENVPLNDILSYKIHDISDSCPHRLMDYRAIHVLVVGNFDDETPTIAQQQALRELVKVIVRGVPTVRELLFHSDVSGTSCPGVFFRPTRSELQRVFEEARATTEVVLFEPLPNVVPVLRVTDTYINISLAWSSVAPALYYRLYRRRASTESELTFYDTSATTTYIDTSVVVGELYYYFVTAVLPVSGEANRSNIVSATPTGVIPPTPLEWVFMSAGGQGIFAVDVANPLAPVIKGVSPYNPAYPAFGTWYDTQVVTDSQYFYYVTNPATSRNIWIFDWATNPESLTRVGMFTDINQWFTEKPILSGSNTLVCPSIIGTVMLGTMDITDRTAPVLLSSSGGGGGAKGEAGGVVDVNNVYWGAFTKSGANGLYSIPVTGSPIGPPTFRINNTALSGMSIIIGGYLWQATTPGPSQFNIYSINPFSSTVLATYTLVSGSSENLGNGACLLRDNYLFIPKAKSGSRGGFFEIVDVTNPIAPVFVSEGPVSTYPASGYSIVVHGNYLYLASNPSSGVNQNTMHFLVFDISTITHPVLVSDTVLTGRNTYQADGNVWAYPNEGQSAGRNLVV